MRLPLRVWSPGVFEYCPAPFAGVAVKSVIVVEIVGCSNGARVVMSAGSGSPEHEKQTRIQVSNRIPNKNAKQKPQHTAAVWDLPVCGNVSDPRKRAKNNVPAT